jgi:hypothetical protein
MNPLLALKLKKIRIFHDSKVVFLSIFRIQYVLATSYSKLPSGAVPEGMNNEGKAFQKICYKFNNS